MPRDMNAERASRATSDRSILLGPYTFNRVMSARPEVLIGFSQPVDPSGSTGVDQEVIDRFDETILKLMEPTAKRTATGEEVDTRAAWREMRETGDENGVVSFADMGEIATELLGGVVERPTDQPSDSPDGSTSQPTGTSSTGSLPSPEPASTNSTPVAPSTPSIPA